MCQAYSYEGIVPVVDASSYVHPTAVLIGDVIVDAGCYVGACAVLRGDFGRLVLERGSNLQDTCVMHGFPGTDTIVGMDGHIGHGAVLHGCRIERNAMVGMNAVVMDEAVVGENSMVAAMAFVKARMQVPANTLVAGIPAKVLRELTAREIEWKSRGTAAYQQLAVRSASTMRRVTPLERIEPDRQRVPAVVDVVPIFEARAFQTDDMRITE
ncbi:phenylacetic acid degradation protein PaaY [Dyella sp.]|jgi:phenylacetic acid degradation protein|uniref:phenylacetic acid degradation protein PaaY n=1 Tax=Dyella sp. TaxID=1869338 RepID=UPI002FD8B4B5